MMRIVTLVSVLLILLVVKADPFYNSKSYYDILCDNASSSDLVDAVLEYEANVTWNDMSISLDILGYKKDGKYSESEKIQYIYRARKLRSSYRKDIARIRREYFLNHKRIKLKDNLKLVYPPKFEPPQLFVWATDTVLGRETLKEICSKKPIEFKEFLEYIISENGPDSINPESVLRRNLGSFTRLTDEEKTVWLYRTYKAKIQLEKERGNVKRGKGSINKHTCPMKVINGLPPVKPYRATKARY